ncbi:hypothetical protein [Streptomyces sp. NBC_00841]|uniref:hypothetical protein n=1 Tax=Streptomyces sp. NBC_00841 TaxID=2975847 RepID=UPI003FA3CB53
MTEVTEDVHGLRKRSGVVTAPDGLDLGIRPGEERAPPVERGRGGSTAVEILQGHRSRDAGTVSALGAPPRPPTVVGVPGPKSSGRMNRHPPH